MLRLVLTAKKKAMALKVVKICESLLLTPLNPHTRKLINSIKARVSGAEKSGAQKPKTSAANAGNVHNFFLFTFNNKCYI